ncbi:Alpha/Beta hydrolase protein [Aspergillus nidulans var. acristatus]
MPKYLSSPTHSFSIPSIYDSIQLACRIYLPQHVLTRNDTSQWRVRGAIVAHPYASLGGCYDDPVVSSIGGELLEAGYVVGTFNFRGAGGSHGRTSWTAKPELADYVSFYGFMMLYLSCLTQQLGKNPEEIHLILGGYSYGSFIASHLPASQVVADLFINALQSTPAHEILLIVKTVCTLSRDEIPLLTQSPISDANDPGQEARVLLQSRGTAISYLLVSPLLPPVNLFLTLFTDLSLEVATQASGKRRQIPCPKSKGQLCAHRTLAIYGDEDTFTSISKLRKWSDELSSVPRSQFQSAEINGAGHFWREDGVEEQARQALRLWLRQRL